MSRAVSSRKVFIICSKVSARRVDSTSLGSRDGEARLMSIGSTFQVTGFNGRKEVGVARTQLNLWEGVPIWISVKAFIIPATFSSFWGTN